MILFELERVGMRYGSADVLLDVSLAFPEGELAVVLGPNGAGKSTLLRIMAGLLASTSGTCRFRAQAIGAWARRKLAKQLALVPQIQDIQFAFTARQVVLMGRAPFTDGLFESEDDHRAVEQAMQRTDTWQFRDRDVRSLSGGERQRVLLASSLAQSPTALLLDEPTTYLDLRHQLMLYSLLRELCSDGVLVVVVTHDLNLAVAHADRIVLIGEGRVLADGTPGGVITSANLMAAFAVDVNIHCTAAGRPWITYGA